MKESRNYLATKAMNVSKVSKSTAQWHIAELYEQLAQLEDFEKSGAEKKLIELYRFFKPTPPKTAKTAFDWVGQAVSTEKHRDYIHHIFVADGRMQATDGHRLHVAKTDLKNGFYAVTGEKLDVDLSFPDTDGILPDKDKMTKFNIDLTACDVQDYGKGQCYKIGDALLNTKFIDSVTLNDKLLTIYMTDKLSPVYIENKFGFAVIMPMRG